MTDIFIAVLSITSVQIPGLIIRYLPFANVISKAQKKKILYTYISIFVLQNVVLNFILHDKLAAITPLTYKRLIFACALAYVIANIVLIRNKLFRHLFIVSMQSGYSLFLHSLIAVIMSNIGEKISIPRQFALQTILYTILFTVVTVPLWKYVRKTLIYKYSAARDYYWNIIWLIPALAVYSDVITTMNDQWINTWPQIVSRLLTALALIVSWKCIYLDFEALEKLQNLESVNKLLHIQKESIIEQADILNENEKKIRIYKHDMRHSLHILLSLIENNSYEEAIKYIRELRSDLQSSKQIEYCRNRIINAVLLVYISRAEDHGIEIEADIDIPENINYSSNDIAILIANALENAYNASTKQPEGARKITMQAKYSDNKLAIKIQNKFAGEVLFNESGLPESLEDGHGIGMLSILSVIDKYNGHLSCNHNKGWFNMSCFFTNP